MSYLNINYSTLEDAWGSNFEKSKKKSKQSHLCNLYQKRNNRVYKPYKTVQDSTHIRPIYEDEDYTKYHGYKDGRPYSRKANRLAKYNLEFPYKGIKKSNVYVSDEEDEPEINEELYEESFEPIITPPKVNIRQSRTPNMITNYRYIDEEDDNVSPTPVISRHYIVEEEDEDEHEFTPILPRSVPEEEDKYERYNTNAPIHKKSGSSMKKRIDSSFIRRQPVEEEDTDDEFEEYLVSKVPVQKKTIINTTPSSKVIAEEEDYDEIMRSLSEEIMTEEEESYVSKKRIKKPKTNERVVLDIILYTISGVLLIFIMEQFIQIGIKIKTPI